MLQRHSPWRKLRLVLSVTVQAVSGAPRRMAIARRRSTALGPEPPAGTIRESPASPFLHPCKLYTRELGGAVHGSWLPVQDNSLRSLYAKQPSSFTARPAIATSAGVPLPDAWPHSCYIANCARESQPQVGTWSSPDEPEGRSRERLHSRRARMEQIMATIVQYTDRKKPQNLYPDRIISPQRSMPCCFSDMEEIGTSQQDGRWLYQYKRCRTCGFTVRLILGELADEALLAELRQILETAFLRNVPD